VCDLDTQWIRDIRQDDYVAFAAMVKCYYTGLFNFAYSYTGSPETAEDLVQDVLLNVWKNRKKWSPQSTAKAYLFRSVRNRSLNALRDNQPARESHLTLVDTLHHHDESPEHDLRYQQLLSDYHDAIEAMPERRRLIYRLNRLYDLTYLEIAATLDISINTVRTQMTAAFKHLRTHLGHHLD